MRVTLPLVCRAATLALAAAVVAACSEDPGVPEALLTAEPVLVTPSIALYHPRVLEPSGGSAAALMVIVDMDGRGDRLLSVACDGAGSAMLHESYEKNGVRRMRMAADGVEIPAGGRVALAGDGSHVMLEQLGRELRVGDSLTLELRFERAGEVELELPVVSAEQERSIQQQL